MNNFHTLIYVELNEGEKSTGIFPICDGAAGKEIIPLSNVHVFTEDELKEKINAAVTAGAVHAGSITIGITSVTKITNEILKLRQ